MDYLDDDSLRSLSAHLHIYKSIFMIPPASRDLLHCLVSSIVSIFKVKSFLLCPASDSPVPLPYPCNYLGANPSNSGCYLYLTSPSCQMEVPLVTYSPFLWNSCIHRSWRLEGTRASLGPLPTSTMKIFTVPQQEGLDSP